MFAANTYRIHIANDEDTDTLRDLADRNSDKRLDGPVLIGEIDGVGAAALSLSDGRVIADSSRRMDHVVANLRLRAASMWAHETRPSLNDRLVAVVPARYRPNAEPASATHDESVEQQYVVAYG